MSTTAETLQRLLPAIHRIRDAEIAAELGLDRGPLEELLALVARELAVLEEGIEQSYDDLFIETCAEWLVPYIGDLIGYESLHGQVPDIASPRAEVAHTIALRRRKGTAVVLEQLARDVTRWDARAVEFFQTLATTQYMNHLRLLNHRTPDLRKVPALERIGGPFNQASHSVEVRRIASGRGRHNIPNVGIFLWRLQAYRHRSSPAVPLDDRRFMISPLGQNRQLFTKPDRSAEAEITHLAKPINVPEPLARRQLHRDRALYYGLRETAGAPVDLPEPSLVLEVDGNEIARDQIEVCNLADDGPTWAHVPPDGLYGIDPVLGRVACPADLDPPESLRVTYHRGFSAEIGGGEYEREDSFALREPENLVRVPDDQPNIQAALTALGGNGVVEITDNGRYEEDPAITILADSSLELRAANGRNPTLVLSQPMSVVGAENARFALNGLLVTGAGLSVPAVDNDLAEIAIRHCSLVPGLALDIEGNPSDPSAASLIVETADTNLVIERSILGGLRLVEEAEAQVLDSVIDATDPEAVAYAGLDGDGPGGPLTLVACTVVGKLHARRFELVSNAILLARLATGDSWPAPVMATQRQSGCIRFSFLPFEAIVPRRFRCQPDSLAAARRVTPSFTTLTFGEAAYCQLAASTPDLIRRGADSESEMGVFHHLYGPQREANLRIRLQEYLRVGLEAGIFYET